MKKASKPVRTKAPKSHSPVAVGNAVFIRTVAMYYTGRIVEVNPREVVLVDAAWIADTGRFSLALKGGQLAEVEPYPDGPVAVPHAGIVDVCIWCHALPREVK